MKKTISILLALALVLCMGTVSVFAADTDGKINISADVASAKVGDIVTVTVSATPDSAKGMGALEFEIVYDSTAFEYVADSFADAYFFSEASLNDTSGTLLYSATQLNAVTKTGTVATAKFKVLKTNGSISLNLTSVALGNFNTTDVTASTIANSVTSVAVACAHTYGAWTVKTPSTCQVAGTEARVCTGCGHEETRALPLAAHTAGAWEVISDADCTTSGERVKKCTVCGEIVDSEVLPALGHDITNWTETVAPGCDTVGEKTGTCSRCGLTVTEEIPALGHEIAEDAWDIVKEATCTEAGSKTGVCDVCGDTVTEVIPALGHDYGEWKVVKEATETETGLKERVCSICGDKETVVIDKLSPAVTTDSNVPNIPKTSGVVAGSIAAFAMLSMAAGVAAVTMKKKHEDD